MAAASGILVAQHDLIGIGGHQLTGEASTDGAHSDDGDPCHLVELGTGELPPARLRRDATGAAEPDGGGDERCHADRYRRPDGSSSSWASWNRTERPHPYQGCALTN